VYKYKPNLVYIYGELYIYSLSNLAEILFI